ncbi:C6 transcription factor [Colletotrichum plurivorum]|uniref:C6 transcription factor n=1 Tax=Colletotrichum plurivorum TaxID=2175906 RepID=A0A8H6JTP3_9PEZI|nr:C6 transcription factor [Colletotrichum plurivorum]
MSDDGDLSWSDNNSNSSDDNNMNTDMPLPHSPPSPAAAWINAAAAPQSHTGQLSPVSTGMDMATVDPSCAPTMVPSASSSSCTDSWSTAHADAFDGDDADNDIPWEQGSDDILTVPKLEPLDDDFRLDDVKEAPLNSAESTLISPTTAQPKQKRPRGRPRKHPLAPVVNPSKVTKGRSKTGCITCRRRKKKCDEAKPRCMNCEKNAVVCEGYHEKKLWRSGKEKAGDDRVGVQDPLVFTMQPLFNGVDTIEDKIFWRHYGVHLSNVLTVEGEAKNAFKDIILPLANLHQGVMHSILAMSSKHIDFDTPYGAKLLQQHPNTNREALKERSDYHHKQAMESFYADIRRSAEEDVDFQTISSARFAQMLCLLVTTLIEGDPHGAHRVHLRGYKELIQQTPPEDTVFLSFIQEFFQYHIYADELLWHPATDGPRLASEDWSPLVPIESPRLLGVADGLFQYLCHITTIRNTIRENVYRGSETAVNYQILYRAQEIQEAIDKWQPLWPPGDSRHRVGHIYKHMMFLHLFRTIYPPTAAERRASVFSVATSIATSTSSASSRRHSQISRPSTATSCASSPGLRPSTGVGFPLSMQLKREPNSRGPSRTSSMHESDAGSSSCAVIDEERAASPPPIRRPSQHDNRITAVVEESLTMMEGFKPSDPALTLLLMPCLVIGATCFDPAQQERVRTVIRSIRGYTGLRNCDRVVEVLEELWHLMDFGDWISVWDWQGVARRLGLDFLGT